jgi:hypothetical protein
VRQRSSLRRSHGSTARTSQGHLPQELRAFAQLGHARAACWRMATGVGREVFKVPRRLNWLELFSGAVGMGSWGLPGWCLRVPHTSLGGWGTGDTPPHLPRKCPLRERAPPPKKKEEEAGSDPPPPHHHHLRGGPNQLTNYLRGININSPALGAGPDTIGPAGSGCPFLRHREATFEL